MLFSNGVVSFRTDQPIFDVLQASHQYVKVYSLWRIKVVLIPKGCSGLLRTKWLVEGVLVVLAELQF